MSIGGPHEVLPPHGRRRVPPHAAPDYPYRDLMAFRAAISEVRCRCNR